MVTFYKLFWVIVLLIFGVASLRCELLRSGLRRREGNRVSIDFWKDPWFSWTLSFKLITSKFQEEEKVANFILP